jgi:hypothetical protein
VEESIPESLKRLDEEMYYSRYRYRSKPLHVSPLGPTHLQQFAQHLSVKRGKPLSLTPQAEHHIMEVSQGLPLLMILALDSLLEHGKLRWENKQELLQEYVQRVGDKFQQYGLAAENAPPTVVPSG